jgi:DNA-binding NtrC family response regulator
VFQEIIMAAAAVRALVPQSQPAPRTPKTILIVEDENLVCDVTCDVLEQNGYRVFRAGNAADARQLFSQHQQQVELLLCDAILPDENGIALATRFRQQSAALRIIIASGYPTSLLNTQCPPQPGTEFLSKPYSSSQLIAMVRRLLNENEPAAAQVASEQVIAGQSAPAQVA